MGIPLATEREVRTNLKREKEEERDTDLEPAAAKARLENISDMPHEASGQETPAEFDVSEIFSPPRVSAMAGEMGLRPGYSLDCTWQDEKTNLK